MTERGSARRPAAPARPPHRSTPPPTAGGALPPSVAAVALPLFDIPEPSPDPEPAPAGPRPWDPIDAADTQLGWQYRWITPARAREIREEIRPS